MQPPQKLCIGINPDCACTNHWIYAASSVSSFSAAHRPFLF
uniref:Uncharacterized protein n=1 Tax=Anguilla anguilla TaxID=7936 RepID=A0A0E9SJ69_ANGAN